MTTHAHRARLACNRWRKALMHALTTALGPSEAERLCVWLATRTPAAEVVYPSNMPTFACRQCGEHVGPNRLCARGCRK